MVETVNPRTRLYVARSASTDRTASRPVHARKSESFLPVVSAVRLEFTGFQLRLAVLSRQDTFKENSKKGDIHPGWAIG